MKKQLINTLIWAGIIVGVPFLCGLVIYILFVHTAIFIGLLAASTILSIAYGMAGNAPIYKSKD